jgi:hypothetical protein
MTKRGRELRALAAGRRSARTGNMPTGYVALVERLAALIVQWCEEQSTLPDLRWLDPGDTVFIGALQGEPVRYLADSPDAFRLVAWLDEQTNHEGTLLQLTVALRGLGHLPGGTAPDVVRRSQAMRHIEEFATGTGTSTRHDRPRPCPHCRKNLDGASGPKGSSPGPGDFSICVYCCGVMRFDDDLQLVPVSESDLDALAADGCASEVATLRQMRDMYRASRMKMKGGGEA